MFKRKLEPSLETKTAADNKITKSAPEFNLQRRLFEVGYISGGQVGLNEVAVWDSKRGRPLLQYDSSTRTLGVFLPKLDDHGNYNYSPERLILFYPDWRVTDKDGQPLLDNNGEPLSTNSEEFENLVGIDFQGLKLAFDKVESTILKI